MNDRYEVQERNEFHIRKYLMEALGTFFLVYTIGMSFQAFAIAFILAGFIYVGASISGAHYNPAITLGVWLRGRLETFQVIPYMIAQFLGGFGAALLIRLAGRSTILAEMLRSRGQLVKLFVPQNMFIAEFLFTFALVLVVLHAATSKASQGNQYYGFVISTTLLAGIMSMGTISGGIFNPAVALSLPFMAPTPLEHLAIYVISNFLGAAAAAGVFLYLNPNDR